MKRNILSIVAVLLTMMIAINLTAQDKERKVLFIGIDGCRSDALQLANTPVMDALFEQGLYTYTSWHLGITVSGPSWSDMLTGVWEPKHGVTNNSYTGSNFDDYPYLVTRVREYRPDLKAVQITSWGPFSFDVYNVDWNQDILVGSDDACRDAALLQLLDPDLDFMYLHFDDGDATGHGQGFSPDVPAYINILEYIDGQVGEVVAALNNRPTLDQEDWLILFTTDHGGIGFGHGGNSLQEKQIWWAAVGSTVEPGEITIDINDPQQWLNAPVLTDIAVTAIDHLLPEQDIEDLIEEWDLDGKSWLSDDVASSTHSLQTVDHLFSYNPNPTSGQINIQFFQIETQATLTLSDITGKVMEQRVITPNDNLLDLDLTTYNPGTYILELTTSNYRQTEKVVLR